VHRDESGERKAVQALAADHGPLLAALADGHVLTKSAALQLAKWTTPIPAEYRAQAEDILIGPRVVFARTIADSSGSFTGRREVPQISLRTGSWVIPQAHHSRAMCAACSNRAS
jgi:hypothetical protein